MINGIGNNGFDNYNSYGNYNSIIKPVNKIDNDNQVQKKELQKTGKIDCETCNNRKYVDGSNEGNVSFKAPTHISPEASMAAVSAHENEHVANAVRKGNEPNAELISSSVRLQAAICPECGTSYIAGGETTTQIRYSNQDNPYAKMKKSLDSILLKGMNVDLAA